MIEKFDFTQLVCMGGNMDLNDFEESQRLRWLVNNNHENLEYHFEQARFFAKHTDDIHAIISYCYIINNFDNNLIAYEELSEYLNLANRNEWAMIVASEGLLIHNSQKLKDNLKNAVNKIINIKF